MPLAHRIFVLSVLPACLVLLGAFVAVSRVVGERVTEGVRQSLRREQKDQTQARQTHEEQVRQVLGIVAENSSLKAALGLARAAAESGESPVLTESAVVDSLRQVAGVSQCDVMMLWDSAGKPLAGLVREIAVAKKGELGPMRREELPAAKPGLATIRGLLYSMTPVAVAGEGERIGTLALGRRIDVKSMAGMVALIRDGEVLDTNVSGPLAAELRSEVRRCQAKQECHVELAGESHLSMPLEGGTSPGDAVLRSFQSVDAAATPLMAGVRRVFYVAAGGSLLAGLLLVGLLSRAVVQPLVRLVDQLKSAERTGLLVPGFSEASHTGEVNQLAHSFNRAATSVVESRKRLGTAYVAFVETLAQALDARDLYTAGHSRRVSEYSCAIADQMRLPEEQIAVIRVGALLHDLGKVGVPDQILQKPGPLTVEEFEILKQHPVIGKRILEPCDGFQQYLPIVELHHENHDGTGYPWQLADSAIPIEARIVHVADAYDAMTTDRPYRRGMPHETAIDRLRASSGTQFDPAVITAVEQMCGRGWRGADDWRSTQQHPGVVALVRALHPEEARKVARVEDHQRS